jgi:hypothetical protein
VTVLQSQHIGCGAEPALYNAYGGTLTGNPTQAVSLLPGCSTCQSKSNFNNIKNNGKGYSAEACGPTNFGQYARAHNTDGASCLSAKLSMFVMLRSAVMWNNKSLQTNHVQHVGGLACWNSASDMNLPVWT